MSELTVERLRELRKELVAPTWTIDRGLECILLTQKEAGDLVTFIDSALSGERREDLQVIQSIYTRSGRAVVCGIPDERHNCDAMGCSSIEHVLWRGPHTVDEKPARDAMTDWRNGENMAVQNKRAFENLVDVVTGQPIDSMKRTYGGVTKEQFDQLQPTPAPSADESQAQGLEPSLLRCIHGKLPHERCLHCETSETGFVRPDCTPARQERGGDGIPLGTITPAMVHKMCHYLKSGEPTCSKCPATTSTPYGDGEFGCYGIAFETLQMARSFMYEGAIAPPSALQGDERLAIAETARAVLAAEQAKHKAEAGELSDDEIAAIGAQIPYISRLTDYLSDDNWNNVEQALYEFARRIAALQRPAPPSPALKAAARRGARSLLREAAADAVDGAVGQSTGHKEAAALLDQLGGE